MSDSLLLLGATFRFYSLPISFSLAASAGLRERTTGRKREGERKTDVFDRGGGGGAKQRGGRDGRWGKRGSAMMGCEFHSGQSGGGLVTISSLSTEGEEKKK